MQSGGQLRKNRENGCRLNTGLEQRSERTHFFRAAFLPTIKKDNDLLIIVGDQKRPFFSDSSFPPKNLPGSGAVVRESGGSRTVSGAFGTI